MFDEKYMSKIKMLSDQLQEQAIRILSENMPDEGITGDALINTTLSMFTTALLNSMYMIARGAESSECYQRVDRFKIHLLNAIKTFDCIKSVQESSTKH